jgi:NAD(P)-dependent dehydrogenase (short-subunit alcohol dehydrogenase family)
MNGSGRAAIITGGSQGTGAGLVDGYRQRGWAVVATSRTIKPSKDPDMITVEGDISQPATAEHVIGAALERFRRVDTLRNNAGVFCQFSGPLLILLRVSWAGPIWRHPRGAPGRLNPLSPDSSVDRATAS